MTDYEISKEGVCVKKLPDDNIKAQEDEESFHIEVDLTDWLGWGGCPFRRGSPMWLGEQFAWSRAGNSD